MVSHANYKVYKRPGYIQKRAAIIKSLRNHDVPSKIIAEKMGLSISRISWYSNLELDPKWAEFEKALDRIYMEKDFDMMLDIYKNIKKKMPKARFRDLVELLKVQKTTGRNNMNQSQNLSQTNIHFEITDGTKEIITAEDKKENEKEDKKITEK